MKYKLMVGSCYVSGMDIAEALFYAGEIAKGVAAQGESFAGECGQ